MWDCENCGTTGIANPDFCPHCFTPRVATDVAPADDSSGPATGEESAGVATTDKPAGKKGSDA